MHLLRYVLFLTAAVWAGLAPAAPARADMAMYRSAGITTASILEQSYVDITPRVRPDQGGRSITDSGLAAADVGNPALLPGLFFFALTGLAYLWQWRSKARTGPKARAGSLA